MRYRRSLLGFGRVSDDGEAAHTDAVRGFLWDGGGPPQSKYYIL